MAVVLPQPDGPTSTQISPAGTSKLRSWIAGLLRPLVGLGDVAELEGRRLRVRRRPLGMGVWCVVTRGRPRRGGPVKRSERQIPAHPARVGVRGALEVVLERRQRLVEPQRRRDQPVGEPRVLGQQRAVEVGADDVAAQHALEARGARVAVALAARGPAAAPPGPGACARRGSRTPPARALRASPGRRDLDGDVADQPRAVLAHGVQVDEPDARDPLVAELVVVAEQLVAAAHGRGRRGRRRPRRAGRRAWCRPCPGRTAPGRGPGRRRCRRGRARRGRSPRRARRRRPRSRCRATGSGARAAAGCRGRRRCS